MWMQMMLSLSRLSSLSRLHFSIFWSFSDNASGIKPMIPPRLRYARSHVCSYVCRELWIDVDGSKATSFTTCSTRTGHMYICHFTSRFCPTFVCACAVWTLQNHCLALAIVYPSVRSSDNNNLKPRCERALTELINNIVYVLYEVYSDGARSAARNGTMLEQ